MLYEEQAAELLRRCEALAGRTLHQLRGNLAKASTRAEAVWELLMVEAASQLGEVECEAPHGGPDIRLLMPSGRWVSVEVTYLHPRFEGEQRRWRLVTGWMAEAESTIGPPRVAFECHFEGGRSDASGTRLRLPHEHERKRFLESAEVGSFLAAVRARPELRHHAKLTDYSVTLRSRPRLSEKDMLTNSSGPALESPKTVAEHAAFRSLRAKVDQHKVAEPYVVCIGSDVSGALRTGYSGLGIRLQDVLGAAVRRSGRLSGVLVVPIETKLPILSELTRYARPTFYAVANSRFPLSAAEVAAFQTLNLNRWKYTFPLARREVAPKHRRRKVAGPLTISHTRRDTVKLTIPAPILVDVLAGRTSLLEEYGGDNSSFGRQVLDSLRAGWSVVGCSFRVGNLEQAKAATVELELAPPHSPVFWADGENKS